MRKVIIGAVATASIVGGAVGIAAVSPLGLAGAQDSPGTTVPAPAPTPSTPSAGTPDHKPGPPGHRGGNGSGPLSETLKELVANGTITQAQADAITEKMKSKVGHGHPGGKPGPGGFGRLEDFGATAAAAIGIDVQTLMTEVKGGSSIADVARAHGVDPQKVIDALVTKATAEIDKAVADGKLPADKADAAKAKLGERITAMVNGSFKGGPGHGPMGHGKGNRPAPDDQNPNEPAAPAPAPPTTAGPSTTAPRTSPTTGTPTTSTPATSAPATTAPVSPGTTAR